MLSLILVMAFVVLTVVGLSLIRDEFRIGLFCSLCGLASGGISLPAYIASKTKKSRADAIKPDSACGSLPVVFVGWDGSAHTFVIANATFREQFQRDNS